MKKGTFKIGKVVTVVYWRSICNHGLELLDWASSDAKEAREFAIATSCCGDVDFVEFHNAKNKRPQFFIGGEKAKLCPLTDRSED